jgi:hypothetical protein
MTPMEKKKLSLRPEDFAFREVSRNSGS